MTLLATLLLAACSTGGGALAVNSPTTTEPGPDSTTTTTTPGGEDPPTGGACEVPVWVLERPEVLADQPATDEPPIDGPSTDEPSTEDPSTDDPSTDSDDCQPGPELGTGDVQITLRWSSSADLDLHVIEPDGTEIWYGDRGPTSTGGRLDVDSNVGCEEDGSVENVFWEEGHMPEGDYTIDVVGFTVDGCGGGDYTITAKVRGEEVLNETGSVGQDEDDDYHFTA